MKTTKERRNETTNKRKIVGTEWMVERKIERKATAIVRISTRLNHIPRLLSIWYCLGMQKRT